MTIRVALDWTPNVIHTGLLVAHDKGYYREVGLEVSLISPAMDNYAVTPASKLVTGDAELAICPSESIIAYAEGSSKVAEDQQRSIQAVFALLDQDASSILCSSKAGIARPADLDGKTYGSYNAKYEDNIIRAMIRNDGGKGDIKIAQETAKLDLFELLTKDSVDHGVSEASIDATWIFSPWEGVKAKRDNFSGKEFRMKDFGIPYGYSPLLARASTGSSLSEDDLKKFIAATRKAYEFAATNNEETVQILARACPGETREFLAESLAAIQPFWHRDNFGHMQHSRWVGFLDFLREEKLLMKSVDPTSLYFNP